ncbi:MAG: putative bifunctional diguanylate cyclase/phosphodiesterase [Sphingobium sp.]
MALYRAKEAGRGVACFFGQAMDALVRERRALEHDLRHAILRKQFHVAYQPLVTTDDSLVSGYEALLRRTHPERREIEPDRFIPIAETGSIIQIGEWVLREACRAAAKWEDHLSVAVNVSPVQFQVANLVEMVSAVLAEEGLAPGRLELEITEGVLMKDREGAIASLRRLKALGVRVVMNDSGTGYSSLSNLQSFPFDKIKIDRSFVAAMEDDDAARSIIRAIVSIGRSLILPVVAEGVETDSQHRMIVEEGCPHVQGYLFGRPGAGPLAKCPPEQSSLVA